MMLRITNSFGTYLFRDERPTTLLGREAVKGDLLEDGEWVPDSWMFTDRGARCEQVEEQLELRAA